MTEIEDGTTAEGWSISLDAVLLHIEERAETFFRFYYTGGGSMSDLPERFNEENVTVLLDYLEDRGLKEARQVFRRKGLYLDTEDLIAWEEFFFSVTLSALASHIIDEDDLEIALSGCQDPTDGLRFYCEARFTVDDLIERALRIYGQSRKSAGLSLLRRRTREQFRRRLLREEILFSALIERLRETAVRRGWIRSEVSAPVYLREDLALLGFLDLPDEARLKERYRELLKKYHPDLNRNSEAVSRTQELNASYARICAYAGRVGDRDCPRANNR